MIREIFHSVLASRATRASSLVILALASCFVAGPLLAADGDAAKKANAPAKFDGPALAASVKGIFRASCAECHGNKSPAAGLKILDHKILVKDKQEVTPGKPEESTLIKMVTSDDNDVVMPPGGRPKLRGEDIEAIRNWISAGAPEFPADVEQPVAKDVDPGLKDVVGVDYVLKQIHGYVSTLNVADRRYVRFFSTNHMLTAGASRAELDLQYQALCKAINHLSWERRIVHPKVIDGKTATVFAIDLRELGWQKQPYQKYRDGHASGRANFNLFDLALLEYPYAALYQDSETFDQLMQEFIVPSEMVRPIAYLRADWFSSNATLPPLYEDFLQLPFELADLEKMLAIDSQREVDDRVAQRAGMSISFVSRNNRVVERHRSRDGSYWKSFDFRTSKGNENMFIDPLNLHPVGGEMIFTLPNGLQGYLLALGSGARIEAAPTEIVTDKAALDKVVRNGLSCIRCHDRGMKEFSDNVRDAVLKLPGSSGLDKRFLLELYPEEKVMKPLVKEDTDRFMGAMERVLGKSQKVEPLTPVSQNFLDSALSLPVASSELGLASPADLEHIFRTPTFTGLGLLPLAAGGVVRRDMWEDYYDQVVRALGIGIPIVPVDGLTRPDLQASPEAANLVLTTNKKNNIFAPGDEMFITVKNKSHVAMYVELIGTGVKGEKVLLVAPQTVAAGETLRFPKTGAIKVQPSLGKERISMFANPYEFPCAEILRGENIVDRAVHPFYTATDIKGYLQHTPKGGEAHFDPGLMIKKTIDIETK